MCGLGHAALPVLSGSAWKICFIVAMRQLVATSGPVQRTETNIPLSVADFQNASGLARVTVIVREAVESGWLKREGRRTPHGGNAVALYSSHWVRAEREGRKI
jgi:hypothetical protein